MKKTILFIIFIAIFCKMLFLLGFAGRDTTKGNFVHIFINTTNSRGVKEDSFGNSKNSLISALRARHIGYKLHDIRDPKERQLLRRMRADRDKFGKFFCPTVIIGERVYNSYKVKTILGAYDPYSEYGPIDFAIHRAKILWKQSKRFIDKQLKKHKK